MSTKAFKAMYRGPERDMDFIFICSELHEAAEEAKKFFTAIQLFGLPGSSLKIRQIQNVKETFSPA